MAEVMFVILFVYLFVGLFIGLFVCVQDISRTDEPICLKLGGWVDEDKREKLSNFGVVTSKVKGQKVILAKITLS